MSIFVETKKQHKMEEIKMYLTNFQKLDNDKFEGELYNGLIVSGEYYITSIEKESPNLVDGKQVCPRPDVIGIDLHDVEYHDENGNTMIGQPEQKKILEEIKSMISGYYYE